MYLEIRIINLLLIIVKLPQSQIQRIVIMVIGIMIRLQHSSIYVYLENKEFIKNQLQFMVFIVEKHALHILIVQLKLKLIGLIFRFGLIIHFQLQDLILLSYHNI